LKIDITWPSLLLLAIFFTACASTPAAPTHPEDQAYQWKTGALYDVTFNERLSHEPRAGKEPAAFRTTVARYTLHVLAVDAQGLAHVHLAPREAEITTKAMDQPPVTHSGWLDRDRELFDYSPGTFYLRQVAGTGVHLVVDGTGRVWRDFRGGSAPSDFLARDTWPKKYVGLTVYPRRDSGRVIPALFAAYVPADWRTAPAWEWPIDFAPHPPMIGLIPCTLRASVVKREGSLLTLAGRGQAAGKPATKSPFGLIQYGDVTLDLRFTDATFEARFDTALGVPTSSRLEYRWVTQRYVDRLAEVISDDAVVLSFQISEMK
jgi:hypothetical protein